MGKVITTLCRLGLFGGAAGTLCTPYTIIPNILREGGHPGMNSASRIKNTMSSRFIVCAIC